MTLPKKLLIITLAAVPCLLFTVHSAHAAEYQRCTPGQNCTVGEFLFDDNYQPIATASCNLTSRDPGGNLFMNNVGLPGAADGWYAHTFSTIGQNEGLYRSQICCTVDTDYLCIDKSFTISPGGLTTQQVQNAVWDANTASFSATGSFGERLQQTATASAQDNATAVWNYTNRTLSGFGTLITDIWNYSSRSLTSFGTLVSSIWTHENRSITQNPDLTPLANKTDVKQIKEEIERLKAYQLDYTDRDLMKTIATQVVENRDLLDALVNQPIIQSSIEEGDTPDLLSKINQTKQVADELYAGKEQLQSRSGLISLKWDELSIGQIDTELTALLGLIGDPANIKPGTLVNNTNWIKDAWGGDLAAALDLEVSTIRKEFSLARDRLEVNPKAAQTNLQTGIDGLDKLDQTIGNLANTSTDPTLFGKLKEVQELAAALDRNEQDLNELLAAWNDQPSPNRSQKIAALNQNVLKVNRLSNAKDIIDRPAPNPQNQEKNQVLGLQAVNSINRLLLAVMKGKPVKTLWLEEGSVIFRTLVTNPSTRIAQTVPLKYYLPKEVKQEDIIQADSALKIEFDPTQGALSASADVNLEPEATRTFAIEVADIWIVKKDEVESLQKQAGELMKPLEKTAYFGQGATLKSDVDVILTKILTNLNVNRPPDARIRFYRESQIELAGAQTKIDHLKDLVAAAGNAGSTVSFMGGTQALATLAIILVIIAASVFMVIYLRILRAQAVGASATRNAGALTKYALPLNLSFAKSSVTTALHADREQRANPHAVRATRTFMILVVVISSSIFTLTMLNIRATRQPTSKNNPERTQTPNVPEAPNTSVLGTSTAPVAPYLVQINVPPTQSLTLYNQASANSAPLITLHDSLKARLIAQEAGFAEVEFTLAGTPIVGWIDSTYVKSLTP
jgi:hypothetical protein